MAYYASLMAAILIGIAAQIALKSGANGSVTLVAQFLNPLTMFGLALYGVAAVCYIVALKKIPVSIALSLGSRELRDRGRPRTFAMERAFRLAATGRHCAHRQRGVAHSPVLKIAERLS
jgi:hypothetical protein